MTQLRPVYSNELPPFPDRTEEQKSVDAFVALDEQLTKENAQPDTRSPVEVTLSEACAVRILVKHYGWVVLEPGTLKRHRK